MNKIEKIAKYVRDNLLIKENLFADGEINWNYIAADLELINCGLNNEDTVRDPLPEPDFKMGNYEEIDAAFDLIDFTHVYFDGNAKMCVNEDYVEEDVDPNAEELKTYIPGVGMLVTNLGSGKSKIFEF